MPAVVAKTPSWLAVMPTDLAEPAEDLAPEPEEPVARSPDKRVKRGRPLDRAGPAAPKGDATAEAKRGVAAGQRVFQL
jgi:hypothetical protein